MSTDRLHARDWEEMAESDPLWAILGGLQSGGSEKRFGNWNISEFMLTGRKEIASLMQKAGELSLPQQRRRAIDFGCGVGRLTHALRDYFPQCFGVDISDGMVQKAREFAPECEFRRAGDLQSFPAQFADLIYSSLVLPHQPNKIKIELLIKDMIRVLTPGGLLVFQLPINIPWRNRLQLRRRIYRFLRALGISHHLIYKRLNLNPIRMLSVPQQEVENMIREANGTVVSVTVSEVPHVPGTGGTYYVTAST